MAFQAVHDDEALFTRWLSWWTRGGTHGNRTAQAAAAFLQIPEDTLNKRIPRWKQKAQMQAHALEAQGLNHSPDKPNSEGLKPASPQPLSPEQLEQQSARQQGRETQAAAQLEAERLAELEGLPVGELAQRELRLLLKSPDPAVRARVALAVVKDTGQAEGSSPYDALPADALLDRLLLLSAPPLRAQYDAERGRAFLVGTAPRLSQGNSLDADGRLEAGTAE